MDVYQVIKKKSAAYFDQMVKHRRHLHQFPELSFQEFETTKYIESILNSLDIPVEKPMETGCIGVLKGDIESNKVVALRADIDALPMDEEGEHKKDFISQNPGVAHCCGHDIHTANLLGSAAILSDLRSQIEGTVLLVFQAGEERIPGGGRLLCETGFLQEYGVQAIYGLHTNPNYKPGEIGVRNSAFMARPDEFDIEIIGTGGHAAAPHETVDPIVIGSQLITAIQTVVSRNVDPNDPAVVTVGRMEGGSAHNIIPERVNIYGTIRTFSEDLSRLISNRLQQLTQSICESMGAKGTFQLNEGYPAVINTEWCVDSLRKAASQIIDERHIVEMDKPIMAGEDFAFYQKEFPGTFFFLGCGSKESGSVYSWHHPKYNVDEECLKTGSAVMASAALQPVATE